VRDEKRIKRNIYQLQFDRGFIVIVLLFFPNLINDFYIINLQLATKKSPKLIIGANKMKS